MHTGCKKHGHCSHACAEGAQIVLGCASKSKWDRREWRTPWLGGGPTPTKWRKQKLYLGIQYIPRRNSREGLLLTCLFCNIKMKTRQHCLLAPSLAMAQWHSPSYTHWLIVVSIVGNRHRGQ